MPFTAPQPVVLQPNTPYVYVEKRQPAAFKRGIQIRNKDLAVTWRGGYEDIVYDQGHPCRYKGIIGFPSLAATVIVIHDLCGKYPKATLIAAGARKPTTVKVSLYWETGSEPVVEPEPIVPDDAQLPPELVGCFYDEDGASGPKPPTALAADPIETEPPKTNIFLLSLPVTP